MTQDCQTLFKLCERFRLLSVVSLIKNAYGNEIVYSYQRFKYIGYNFYVNFNSEHERYSLGLTLTHENAFPRHTFYYMSQQQ